MVPCPSLSAFGGGGRAEEGRGRREEGGGGREQGGGRRREEGGGRREEGEEQAADEVGRELLLDEVEEAVALGHRRVVPGVERREVVAAQIAPVRFRLGVGVAGELERGVREDGVDPQGRPRQERLDHWGRHVGARQGLEASVGADRRVSACAWEGGGVVDLGLGSRAGPVLQEGGRELGIQFGPRVVRQQLAGHVALRLGLGVVVRQIHVPQRIGNLLIDLSGCRNPTEP